MINTNAVIFSSNMTTETGTQAAAKPETEPVKADAKPEKPNPSMFPKRQKRDTPKEYSYLRCEYKLPHKNHRQCHMQRKASEKFCAQHVLLQKDSYAGRERVVCPVDPGHTVWADELQQHMYKCNKVKERMQKEREGWHRDDMNISNPEAKPCVGKKSDITVDYAKWIPVVEAAFKDVEEVPVEILNHEKGLAKRMTEVQNKKHALQQASLIAHMEKTGLLKSSSRILEFGAGRAELSRYINYAICAEREEDDKTAPNYLFIDRAMPRMKMDGKLVKDTKDDFPEQPLPLIKRLKMDIKDLMLDGVPVEGPYESNLIVSKHLCGCATDLTLQCLLNSAVFTKETRPAALVIALCCRQICNVQMFPKAGIEWLQERGFDDDGFAALTRMTSWVLCGERPKKEPVEGEEETEAAAKTETETPAPVGHPSGLAADARKEIGLMCRRLLDQGRLHALRKEGLDARLVQYTEMDISPENVCLIVNK